MPLDCKVLVCYLVFVLYTGVDSNFHMKNCIFKISRVLETGWK